LDGRRFLLMALLASGCEAIPCRAGTLYLTMDYAGASASADQLAIDITVGDAHQRYVRERAPGTRRDTFEVVFHQYLEDAPLVVDAASSRAGQPIGHGHAQATLAPSCTALAMALTDDGDGTDDGGGSSDGSAPLPDGASASSDLAMTPPLPDLAMAPVDLAGADMSLPVVTLDTTESITPDHPNGNGYTGYNDECPTDTAIIGYELQVQTDANGAPMQINRADPVCVGFVPAPNGVGWTVHWGNRQVMTGRGVAGQMSVEYLCKQDNWVVGFAGNETTYLAQLRLSCAPITINPDRTGVNVGPTVDDSNGVGGTGGASFNPIYCPPWKVASYERTDEQSGMPFDAFGLGCKEVTSH
jgi:hypothetical protein